MTRYTERTPGRRAWGVFLGAAVVGWLAVFLVDTSTPWTATLVLAVVGGITALSMWSTGLYGNITLTGTVLRVGRSRVRLEDVDPWGVSAPGERPVGRVLGGAYGQTLGGRAVGLTMRDGTRVLVQSKDPDALRAALDGALAPFRTDVR